MVDNALVPLSRRVPTLIFAVPLYVFAPLRVTVPLPVLVNDPVEPAKEFEMLPLTMISPVPSRVRARLVAALLFKSIPPLKVIDPLVALIVEPLLGVMLPPQVAALALLLNLWRLLRGPALGDRIVALDTMVINAIALIVLIGMAGGGDTYFEAALLLAMVGFVSTIAYCKFILRGDIVE